MEDVTLGFRPAKLTDGGRIRMDPDADDYMRRLQVEHGISDDEVPLMLHQLREMWVEQNLMPLIRTLDAWASRKERLVKNRGSRCRELRLQERDDTELRKLFYQIYSTAKYLADDGKDVMQVILVTEGEKARAEDRAREVLR